MRVGRLRHKVLIQRPDRIPDGQQGYLTAWNTVTDGTVWASIEPLSMTRRLEHGGMLSDATHTITIRHLPGLKADCRVVYGERVFQVVGFTNKDERNEQQVLTCAEAVA